jgi:hypothetical protein
MISRSCNFGYCCPMAASNKLGLCVKNHNSTYFLHINKYDCVDTLQRHTTPNSIVENQQ